MNMRSPLWFVVAGVIGLAGLVAAWLYAVPRIKGFTAGLQQVVMPGPVVISLDRPGAYTLYAETNSVVDGQLFTTPPPNGTRVTLTSEATGEVVALDAVHGSIEYEFGQRKGHAMLGFVIDQPGRYRLAAAGGPTGARYVLAIGHGSAWGQMGSLFRTILVTLALGMGGLGIAGIIVAVTVMQRDKAKRAAKA